MKPKKRLSRKDPGYFVPLPFAMAVKRLVEEDFFATCMFEGMQLKLKREGMINLSIAVTAFVGDREWVIGYIPQGMVSRIEGLMEHEENISVSLERMQCDRLKNSFWICFDELPDLKSLGLETGD